MSTIRPDLFTERTRDAWGRRRPAGARSGPADLRDAAPGDTARAAHATALCLAARAAVGLRSVTPAVRLRLRDHPAAEAFADALAVDDALTGAVAHFHELERARAAVRAVTVTPAGHEAGDRPGGRDQDRAFGNVFSVALRLAGSLAEARTALHRLAASGVADPRAARATADLLSRAAERALDLGRDRVLRADDAALRRLANDLSQARAADVELLRALSTTFAAAAGFDLDRPAGTDQAPVDPGGPAGRDEPGEAAERDELDRRAERDESGEPAEYGELPPVTAIAGDLLAARTDFTGSDLRAIDLATVDLRGVRWSAQTSWPPAWAERVARDSVEVAPGIREIRPGQADAWGRRP